VTDITDQEKEHFASALVEAMGKRGIIDAAKRGAKVNKEDMEAAYADAAELTGVCLTAEGWRRVIDNELVRFIEVGGKRIKQQYSEELDDWISPEPDDPSEAEPR